MSDNQKDMVNSVIKSSDHWVYGFTMVDSGVIDHSDLDIYEKMVYIVIKRMVNMNDHITFPSYETIAKKAGCSRRKAIDSVKKLTELDLIRNMGQHKLYGSNVYMIQRIQDSNVLSDPEKNLASVQKQLGIDEPRKVDKPKKAEKVDVIPYKEIIGYLNEKAGKRFAHTTEKECREFIRGRWSDLKKIGMDDETISSEFRCVIDTKVAHWMGTESAKFLKPSTLFRSSNFDKYRNEDPNIKPFMGNSNGQASDDRFNAFLNSDD